MAVSLDALGRSFEALPLWREGLKLRRQAFEGDHVNVLKGLNNLGYALRSLARYEEAIPLLEESVAMGKRVSGSNNKVRVPSQRHLPSLLGVSSQGTTLEASS